MLIVQQAVFVVLSVVAIYLFSKKVGQIRRNILLGRDTLLNDEPGRRWRNVLLLALGQKKNVP